MFYNYDLSNKENRFTIFWSIFVGLTALISLVITPLDFVYKNEYSTGSLFFEFVISSIFLMDLIFQFQKRIKLPKTKSSLISENHHPNKVIYGLDLISSLPLDIIFYLASGVIGQQYLNIIRLTRLTRIVKLKSIFSLINYFPSTMKVCSIIVVAMISIHWITCGWIYLSPDQGHDPLTLYNISLYWCITTLTTVGYGDITPQTNMARLYTMGVMIFGVGIFGLLVSNFLKMMMDADKYTQQKKEKISSLQEFFKYYGIPNNLQTQVFSFYYHLLEQNITKEDSTILNELPIPLQKEINIYMKIKLIKDIPIFDNCEIDCLKEIAESLEQIFYSPNENIIKQGEDGNEMFIIGHGSVQVMDNNKIISELKAGQFFGEISLIEDTVRNADVHAKDYCDLYIFKKEDFLLITKKFPNLAKRFEKIYQRRIDTYKRPNNSNKAA